MDNTFCEYLSFEFAHLKYYICSTFSTLMLPEEDTKL